MRKHRMGKVIGGLVAVAAVGVLTSGASAMPIFGGTNDLSDGPARGLDENYISSNPAADYKAPNGALASANGYAAALNQAVGMTESLRVDTSGRSMGLAFNPSTLSYQPKAFSDGKQGINVPQPQLLPASDPRSTTTNTSMGTTAWGARTGALLQFTLNTPSVGLGTNIAPGTLTAQAFNLTPGVVSAASIAGLVNDGLAPGSVAGDGMADFLPFVQNTPGGIRTATLQINLIGKDTASNILFPGGVVPKEFLPRLRLFEGGAATPENSPPTGEEFFNHNGGNDLTGTGVNPNGPLAAPTGVTGNEIDKVVDGALVLGGVISEAYATLTWTETAPGSGNFFEDINVAGRLTFDEGFLSGIVTDFGGSFTASWTSMAFNSSSDGLYDTIGATKVDGVTVDVSGAPIGGVNAGGWDFLYNPDQAYVSDYDFDISGASGRFPKAGTGSVDLSFAVAVPEPMTGGLALLAAGALAGYVSRRRHA